MKKIAVLMIAISFLACNTGKQRIRKLDQLVIMEKSEFLRLSNTLNPCFNGKAKADTVLSSDTTFIKGDTLIKILLDTVKITIQRPGKVITIHQKIVDTVPDMRKTAELNDIITQQQGEIQDAQKDTIKARQQFEDADAGQRHYKWGLFGLLAVLIGYIGLRIYFNATGGGAASIIKKL